MTTWTEHGTRVKAERFFNSNTLLLEQNNAAKAEFTMFTWDYEKMGSYFSISRVGHQGLTIVFPILTNQYCPHPGLLFDFEHYINNSAVQDFFFKCDRSKIISRLTNLDDPKENLRCRVFNRLLIPHFGGNHKQVKKNK